MFESICHYFSVFPIINLPMGLTPIPIYIPSENNPGVGARSNVLGITYLPSVCPFSYITEEAKGGGDIYHTQYITTCPHPPDFQTCLQPCILGPVIFDFS